MSSVLEQIRTWANSLDYWEQAALEMVVSESVLTEQDYSGLLGYLFEDSGLAPKSAARPLPQFPSAATGVADKPTTPIRLTRVFAIRNVNALVEDQEITFGPQLTVIFGANRSGKSGYARILLSAASSRGSREILPDATKPSVPSAIPEAFIEISDGVTTHVSGWKSSGRIPELTPFYVFDSSGALVHLTQSTPLGFSPAGLSYLSRLAEITDTVRARLRKQVEEKSRPHNFTSLFDGTSLVRTIIEALGPQTKADELRRLAELSENELTRIRECESEIARLRALNVPDQIRRLERDINDLRKLSEKAHTCKISFNETARSEAEQLKLRLQQSEELAALTGVDQFKSPDFRQVGTSVWRDFIEAAKKLADAESNGREPYPLTGDPCLLCRQPLSAEAVLVIQRLWKFIVSEAPERLAKARKACNAKREEIERIDLSFFENDSAAKRLLQESDAHFAGELEEFVACSRKRRGHLAAMLADADGPDFVALPTLDMQRIDEIVRNHRTQIEALKNEDTAKQIGKLDQELRELNHRRILAKQLDAVLHYVKDIKWAAKANGAGGTTRHITLEHNELFKKLVTDRYMASFQKVLGELGHPVQVIVDTRGQKGETLKQIGIQRHESSKVPRYAVDKVLSDGEKRAVALADFLAEVETDQGSRGIILDDPVNSLDFEWKEAIAARLVREALVRQVIIFTHDLHFFSVLMTEANQQEVSAETHWVKRGEQDEKPGHVFLDNSPACEKNYKDAEMARKYYKKSLACPPEEQESMLKAGFGALRTSYETFILTGLFGGVVSRFREHIAIKPLEQLVWDDSIASTVVEKHESLSRLIEGHSHSDLSSMSKPTSAMLFKEIEVFEDLKRRHRKLKKNP